MNKHAFQKAKNKYVAPTIGVIILQKEQYSALIQTSHPIIKHPKENSNPQKNNLKKRFVRLFVLKKGRLFI